MENYLIKSTLGNELTLKQEIDPSFQLLEREGNQVKFIFQDKIYDVQILELSENGKHLYATINNQKIQLDLQDSLDQLIDKMGMNDQAEDSGGDVISPMPGLILSISVKEGMAVEKGEDILVLEAMKMENLLKAPSSGTITSIKCSVGDSVQKGDLLIQID